MYLYAYKMSRSALCSREGYPELLRMNRNATGDWRKLYTRIPGIYIYIYTIVQPKGNCIHDSLFRTCRLFLNSSQREVAAWSSTSSNSSLSADGYVGTKTTQTDTSEWKHSTLKQPIRSYSTVHCFRKKILAFPKRFLDLRLPATPLPPATHRQSPLMTPRTPVVYFSSI